MNNIYETPILLIEQFMTEDVMTASGGDNDITDPWD